MKILIEKAVIEQALEALEEAREMIGYPANMVLYEEELALREALDPELQFVRDWNEGKVHRVSDGKVMGFAEQEEQEPVAYLRMGSDQRFVVTKAAEELVADTFHQLYAAPVRTKDLTGQDLCDLEIAVGWKGDSHDFDVIVHAVIAKFKEKNK